MEDKLCLEFESDNVYDRKAIKVLTKDRIHIGYVPSRFCETVGRLIELSPKYSIFVYVKTDGKDNIPYILAKMQFKVGYKKED